MKCVTFIQFKSLLNSINMMVEENNEDILIEAENRALELDEAVVGDEEDEVGDAEYGQGLDLPGWDAYLQLTNTAAEALLGLAQLH